MVTTRRCRVASPKEGGAGNHPLAKDRVGWHFPAMPSFPDFAVATAPSPPVEAERAQHGRADRDETRPLEAGVVDCRNCGDPHSVSSHSLSSLVELLYLHMGSRAALNLLTSSPCSSWQRVRMVSQPTTPQDSTNGSQRFDGDDMILSDSYLELLLQLFLGCSSMLGGSPSRVEMDHALVTSSPISMFFLIFFCNESWI
uniref:Uncharacterized protein n=1 Tax=Aegilops tauschii TaxID=37682 RepID=N1QXN4_AEGTA